MINSFLGLKPSRKKKKKKCFSSFLQNTNLMPYQTMNSPHWIMVHLDFHIISFSFQILYLCFFRFSEGFAGGSLVKNLPANAWDTRDEGLIPGLGRSSGGGNGSPNPVFLPGESYGQTSLAATVLRVTKSQTPLSDWAHTHTQLLWISEFHQRLIFSTTSITSNLVLTLVSEENFK